MSTNAPQTLHSENAIFRIAAAANIVAWLVLVISLMNFGNDLYSIVGNWPLPLPAAWNERVMIFVGVLSRPIFGVFYFLLLQGMAQLLYLGLDIHLDRLEEEEEEGEEDDPPMTES